MHCPGFTFQGCHLVLQLLSCILSWKPSFASLVSFLVLTFRCSFILSLPIVIWFQLFPFSLSSFCFILRFFMLSSCFFHFCCRPCPPHFNHSPKPTHGRITWWVTAKCRRWGGKSLCCWNGDKKGLQKGVQKKERAQNPAESRAKKVSKSVQCTGVCYRGCLSHWAHWAVASPRLRETWLWHSGHMLSWELDSVWAPKSPRGSET